MLREGPAGDQLKAWPATMRVFARRERPHPGAQLTLFEAEDGWRYSLWATNRPAGTTGWLGRPLTSTLPTGCRRRSRTPSAPGKDTGLGHFPSFDYQVNAAWLTAAMTAQILLAWLKLLALRRRPRQSRAQDAALPHPARRRPAGARRAAAPPEDPGHLAMGRGHHGRVAADRSPSPRKPPDHRKPSLRARKETSGACGTPGHPARQPGHRRTPAIKSGTVQRFSRCPAPALRPRE